MSNHIKANKKEEKEAYFWKQTFTNEDGQLVTISTDIRNMSKEHLQKAVYKCHNKMLKLHKQMMEWEELWERLEESAKTKGIELLDPDSKIAIDRRHGKNMPQEQLA